MPAVDSRRRQERLTRFDCLNRAANCPRGIAICASVVAFLEVMGGGPILKTYLPIRGIRINRVR